MVLCTSYSWEMTDPSKSRFTDPTYKINTKSTGDFNKFNFWGFKTFKLFYLLDKTHFNLRSVSISHCPRCSSPTERLDYCAVRGVEFAAWGKSSDGTTRASHKVYKYSTCYFAADEPQGLTNPSIRGWIKQSQTKMEDSSIWLTSVLSFAFFAQVSNQLLRQWGVWQQFFLALGDRNLSS